MMPLGRSRIDRFLQKKCQLNRRQVQLLLAQRRILVDGVTVDVGEFLIDKFSLICLDNVILQANTANYIMLHKPIGVVSATQDQQHKTVIDLLDTVSRNELHIVGRLDLNSSGLLLLTNDSRWSSRLTSPDNKVVKQYEVTLANPLSEDYIKAFAEGMYFEYEDIITRPAQLDIISQYCARVHLVEGRYHQIKRMFGRFRNPVQKLHRIAIGNLALDDSLQPSESRSLTQQEVVSIDALVD